MDVLLHPTYFPNIAHFVGIANAKKLIFEVEDNYQKQTYRNRTHIYGANGKLALQIPVKFTQNNRQRYKEVCIANDGKWQLQHLKSLQSAYRTSPFFEYYEDDFISLFDRPQKFLLEFNMACLETICNCLEYELIFSSTTIYEKEVEQQLDLRYLSNVRKEKEIAFDPYIQVFKNKHGYINNLSILDLLFNEGPATIDYLKSQKRHIQ